LLLGEDCHGLGVVARYRLSRPCVVGLVVKPVGKPDAGDPHVRFDEREEETEPWRGLRHRHLAKAAGQQLFPTPSATASLLDSTLASTGDRITTQHSMSHLGRAQPGSTRAGRGRYPFESRCRRSPHHPIVDEPGHQLRSLSCTWPSSLPSRANISSVLCAGHVTVRCKSSSSSYRHPPPFPGRS
jgi:hypothetical protein